MKYKIVGIAFVIIAAVLTFGPWWLPDSWCYIKKSESQYVPLWNMFAMIGAICMMFFSIEGIASFYRKIVEWLSK